MENGIIKMAVESRFQQPEWPSLPGNAVIFDVSTAENCTAKRFLAGLENEPQVVPCTRTAEYVSPLLEFHACSGAG